jgi:MFS family permease
VSVVPLRRNRDYLLLQSGQLLSNTGSQMTTVAYPLLVLAMTGSEFDAGAVAFARSLPSALLAIPAGVLADRHDRRRLMIAADVVRVFAIGLLAVLVMSHDAVLWSIVVVAFVEGLGGALFSAAQVGALRAVVPVEQLPAAAGAQSGRAAAAGVVGPPIGGALFAVSNALPFFADCISYACSTASLLAMRTPFQQATDPDRSDWRARIAEGLRFVWRQPFLRTCALLFGLANFIGPGVMLSVVVIGHHQSLSGGVIGILVASFGAGVVVGSLISGHIVRALPPRAVLLLELWTWVGCAAFVIWPNVYVLAASILPTALVIPSSDSIVHGYRIAMTPDRLLGRSESARRMISLLIAPLGPLVAGILLGVSDRLTIGVFAACGLVLAVWGTASSSIAGAPSLAELREARI